MGELFRSELTLRFFGDDLVPEEITCVLGRSPTVGVHKGGEWTTSRGVTKVARTGSWWLDVPAALPGDFDGQIQTLLATTTPDLEIWAALTTRYKADLFCGLFLKDGNEGISLSPATLRLAADRNLLIDFDIHLDAQ